MLVTHSGQVRMFGISKFMYLSFVTKKLMVKLCTLHIRKQLRSKNELMFMVLLYHRFLHIIQYFVDSLINRI